MSSPNASAGDGRVSTSPSGRTSAMSKGTERRGRASVPLSEMSSERRETLIARAYLLRVAEPPAAPLLELIEEVGPRRAAALIADGRVSERIATATAARRGLTAEQDFDRAAAVGAHLLTPEDDQWPHWRFAAFDPARERGMDNAVPPVALWQRGDLGLADATDSSISIVGSRAATGYGGQVAADLAFELSGRGYHVVSGAAAGIDAAAHRGALGARASTVAVLGCGIDIAYPAAHSRLLDQIAEHGAVLSEYPPGTRPARHRFLVRNRLIAALTDGTVVVEAGRRSGARNTAAIATALGRTVMAVPGPITSAMSVGSNQLLRDQTAIAVTRVEDVIASAGRMGDGLDQTDPTDQRPTDGLRAEARRIHEALRPRVGRHADEIAVDSGVPVLRTRALLCELELVGLARRVEDGWCRGDPPSVQRTP